MGHFTPSRLDLVHKNTHETASRFYRKKGDEFDDKADHHREMHERSNDPKQKLSDEFISKSFIDARKSCQTSKKAISDAGKSDLNPNETYSRLVRQGVKVPRLFPQ